MDDIEPGLCTHIIYSFASLDPVNLVIKSEDTWLDLDRAGGVRGVKVGNFRKFTGLKEKYPDVKFLLAMGGWTDSAHEKYSQLLASPDKIVKFAEHAVGFLQQYGFDGLDLDYEYPGFDGHGRVTPASDKSGFTELCRQLAAAFKPHGLEITAAVSAAKSIIDDGYEIAEVSKHLDAVHLMSYDLHGHWEKKTNHHAPLYADDSLSVDFG